ncbi:ChiQ/YbfN family lipoprotein [Budvicia aquatica]|uniref:ChiQ/YbfN family lipoprotein n=1 Tax=Budvicia aquatica TaxID=82979 RepID=UPI0020846803|nr:ChiQ/YbfN family lipoprotein [Budvicia aquatica]GKX50104.1 lipoprotein [Budvicia aquatica]
MKKILLAMAVVLSLAGCTYQSDRAQEDVTLKDAYSACINTAEGSPEKIQACQSVLTVLKKDKAHKTFADKETVRVLDYQRCIQAAETGNGQAYSTQCGKIWKEIRANNN